LIKAIAEKQKLRLVNFGNFYYIDIKERNGSYPQTKEQIQLVAYKCIKFKAGKFLKEAAKTAKNTSENE